MIKDRNNDTWKIFSNWFSWFKKPSNIVRFKLIVSFELFLKSFQCIYAWRTNIHLVFVMVFLSNPATLVQKYILTSITSFCADIKNSFNPTKHFVISFNGLTINLVCALWSLKQSFKESLKCSMSIFRWVLPFLVEISFSCMSYKLGYMIDKGQIMDVHFESDNMVYVCDNLIYQGFSLILLRTTQHFLRKFNLLDK